MKVIVGGIIEMRKELFTKETKEYFSCNVYVLDDLDEIEL